MADSLPQIPTISLNNFQLDAELAAYLNRVLSAVKENIDTLSGVRGNNNLRALTLSDLAGLSIGTGTGIPGPPGPPGPPGEALPDDEIPPGPVTNFSAVKGIFYNFLSWVNPVDDDLSHIEIWSNTTNNRSAATLIAVVTATNQGIPQPQQYKHALVSLTETHYYWVRAVDFSGNYSTWVPTDEMGGEVVPGSQTVAETVQAILALLRGEDPANWDPGVTYAVGDQVKTSDGRRWICTAENTDEEPPNADYWERFGILMEGDVEGVATVGIDGRLVVSDTILAHQIQVDDLIANIAYLGTITAGILQSSDWGAGAGIQLHLANKTMKWGGSSNPFFSLSETGAYFRGQAVFQSNSSGYANLADKPTSLSDISALDFSALNTVVDVSGSYNLVTDPSFRRTASINDSRYWRMAGGGIEWLATGGVDNSECLKISPAGVVRAPYSQANSTYNYFDCVHGEKYYVRFKYFCSEDFTASNGFVRVQIISTDKDGANAVANNLPYEIPVKGAWTTVDGFITINDADAKRGRVRLYVGASAAGYVLFDEVYVGTSKPGADITSENTAADTAAVSGTAAATVATAAGNFNSRNDRIATAVAAPTVPGDGSCVDHTINTDGSADISFEWIWSGFEADIDGFQIFVYSASSSSAYTFGTTPGAELVLTVAASKRAFILHGCPADRYYTIGVRAFRVVDQDIDSSGLKLSAIVKSTVSGENPYRPSASVAFAGNITGTISGINASVIAGWAHSADTSKIDGGDIYAGSSIVIGTGAGGGLLRIGATAYGTGNGVWMGDDGGTYKFRVGNPSGQRVAWNGSALEIRGSLNADDIGAGSLSADRIVAESLSFNKIDPSSAGRIVAQATVFYSSSGQYYIEYDTGSVEVGSAADVVLVGGQFSYKWTNTSPASCIVRVMRRVSSDGGDTWSDVTIEERPLDLVPNASSKTWVELPIIFDYPNASPGNLLKYTWRLGDRVGSNWSGNFRLWDLNLVGLDFRR